MHRTCPLLFLAALAVVVCPLNPPLWPGQAILTAPAALAAQASPDLAELAKRGNVRQVRAALEAGADLNMPDDNDALPLNLAVQYNSADVVLTLLEAGANPNAFSASVDPALVQAVERGDAAMVRLLLQHKADPHWRDNEGSTLLHIAAMHSSPQVMETLLAIIPFGYAVDMAQQTPLHIALTHGKAPLVLALLLEAYWPDASLLPVLAQNAALKDTADLRLRVDAVQRMLGAPPEIFVQHCQRQGTTLLMYMARHARSVQELRALKWHALAFGLRDVRGRTALHYALRYNSDPSVIQYFIDNTPASVAQPVPKDETHGSTEAGLYPDEKTEHPLLLAARYAGQQAVVAQVLEKFGGQDIRNANGENALFVAARHNSMEVVSLLQKAGSDLQVSNRQGQNILFAAARNSDARVTAHFLQQGISFDVVDMFKKTALLEAAARNQNPAIVDTLLQATQQSKEARNTNGAALLWAATENTSYPVYTLLTKHYSTLANNKKLMESAAKRARDRRWPMDGESERAQARTTPAPVLTKPEFDYASWTDQDFIKHSQYFMNVYNFEAEELVVRGIKAFIKANTMSQALKGLASYMFRFDNMKTFLELYSMIPAAEDRLQAFHYAVQGSRAAYVEYFLNNGANVHAKNKKGATALLVFINDGLDSPENAKVLRLLLNAGADITVSTAYGAPYTRSMLAQAALHFSSPGVVKELLARGADPYSPLDRYPAMAHSNTAPILQAFMDAGVTLPKAEGMPQYKAHDAPSMLSNALRQGKADFVRLLFGLSQPVEHMEQHLLQQAFMNPSERAYTMVRLLQQLGLDIDAVDDEGNTMLMNLLRAEVQKSDVRGRLSDVEAAIVLLRCGADYHKTNQRGDSPFRRSIEKKGPQLDTTKNSSTDIDSLRRLMM